jgi:hypothetical protein
MARRLKSRNYIKNLKIQVNKEVTAHYREKLGYNINSLHPGLRLFIYTEFYQSPMSIPEIEENKEKVKIFSHQKLFKYKLNKKWLIFWELYKRRLWPDIYKEEANNED